MTNIHGSSETVIMNHDDIISTYIKKLSHPLKEIRERSLQLLLNKLQFGWHLCDDLTKCCELIQAIVIWFDQQKTMHREALQVLLIIIKSKSGSFAVKQYDSRKLIEDLKKYRPIIDDNAQNIFEDVIETLQFMHTVDSEENITVPGIELNSVSSSECEINVLQCSKCNVQHSSEESYNERGHNNNQYEIFRSNGLNVYLFPWVLLSPSDLKTIVLIEDSLKLVKSTRRSCRFIRDVFLHDFPAEIFLNRPSIVNVEYENKEYCDKVNMELQNALGGSHSPLEDTLVALRQLPAPIYALNTCNTVLSILLKSVMKFDADSVHIETLKMKEFNTCLSLVEALIEFLLECVTESFWSADHSAKSQRDIAHKSCMLMQFKSKYRELQKLHTSMTCAVQFMRKQTKQNASDLLLSIRNSLPILQIHGNETFLKDMASVIVTKSKDLNFDEDNWSTARSIALVLMCHNMEWVRVEFYKILSDMVKSVLMGDDTQPDQEKCLTLICDVSILTEICCHGLSSCVKELDIADCLGIPTIDMTWGLVRLLFVKCPAVQLDAAHSLCCLLGILVFPANDSHVAMSCQVLSLVAWGGFALQELDAARRRVPSLPFAVTERVALPFAVSSYWQTSPNAEHDIVEWLLTSDRWRTCVRARWWWQLTAGRTLRESPRHIQGAGIPWPPTTHELLVLRSACVDFSCSKLLYVRIMSSSTVRPGEFDALRWENMKRFLTAAPTSGRDTLLLTSLVQFIIVYMDTVPKQAPMTWINSSFIGNDAVILSVLSRDKLYPGQSDTEDLDAIQLRIHIVKVVLRCVVLVEHKDVYSSRKMESLFKIVLTCLERVDVANFHVLGYLNVLLRCLRFCLHCRYLQLSEELLISSMAVMTRLLCKCGSGLSGTKGEASRLDIVLSLLALVNKSRSESVPVQIKLVAISLLI
ncbi:unnamed protein product [Leptidea sinapis]|uniref:Rotatin N-terminal domain-containing protein n=1 Tax=Leptidea sinapis TaxID=189913 RepID=A0A5E4QL95_9NEOP|nr:unnamed protein product [Leptidea sinapis]